MQIGFIGFGEAAYCISSGLAEEGIQGIIAQDAVKDDPLLGVQVKERAAKAGVTLKETPAEVATAADILFVSTPSGYTLDVCNAVCDVLQEGRLYVDVTASTPAVKTQIWKKIKDTGVLFVDAAMLGSLPTDRHQVPITASGNGAAEFHRIMTPYGMKINNIGEGCGDASAVKLVRSIFMKGIASLMVEMLQAADAYGVTDRVVSSIGKSMDDIPFTAHLDRLVTGTAIHAARRSAELKGSLAMLEECGVDGAMTASSKQKHDMLADYKFNEKYIGSAPKGYGEIMEALRKE